MKLRNATMADQQAISWLIEDSTRRLSTQDYTKAQIELALQGAMGLDTQLIIDQTYLVVVEAGEIIACGGWSFRKTLFGSNDREERDDTELVPGTDRAKIRAFFVSPEHARRGIGSLILERCEAEAAEMGFSALELSATLPGVPFYEMRGFIGDEPIKYDVGQGVLMEMVPMHKDVG